MLPAASDLGLRSSYSSEQRIGWLSRQPRHAPQPNPAKLKAIPRTSPGGKAQPRDSSFSQNRWPLEATPGRSGLCSGFPRSSLSLYMSPRPVGPTAPCASPCSDPHSGPAWPAQPTGSPGAQPATEPAQWPHSLVSILACEKVPAPSCSRRFSPRGFAVRKCWGGGWSRLFPAGAHWGPCLPEVPLEVIRAKRGPSH